jgi:hypothetical protein
MSKELFYNYKASAQFIRNDRSNLTLAGAPVEAIKQPVLPRMWAKAMPALDTRLVQ